MPSIGGSQGGSPSGNSNGGNVGPGVQGSIGNFGMGYSTAGELGVADTGMGLMGNPGSRGSNAPATNNSFFGGWDDVSRADPIIAMNDARNASKQGYSASKGFMYGSALGMPLGPVASGLGGLFGAASSFAQGGPSPASGAGPGGLGGPPDGAGVFPGAPIRPPAPPGPQPFRINPMQVQNDMNGGWGQGPGGWGGYQQPQMNPFSMYGTGQPRNQGYNPFSMYSGGK